MRIKRRLMTSVSRSTLPYHFFTWRIGYMSAIKPKLIPASHLKIRTALSGRLATQKCFANAMRDINPYFELIRGIANASKHLGLRPQAVQAAKAHHGHAPSRAANTAVHATGYGTGSYGGGPYGGTPRVMLEGPGGSLLEFLDIAEDVRQMWLQQAANHSWIL